MRAIWHEEHGQGLVEYALIIAVIAITVIVAMVFFRDQLQNYFSSIGNNLTEAGGAAAQRSRLRPCHLFDIVVRGHPAARPATP